MSTSFTALQERKRQVFCRTSDGLMVTNSTRGQRWHYLNESAAFYIARVLSGQSEDEIVQAAKAKFGISETQTRADLIAVCEVVLDQISEQPKQQLPTVNHRWELARPLTGEITLLDRCNNRCRFCYMAAPFASDRARKLTEMSFEQIAFLIKRMAQEVQVRDLILTGGEPSLRQDLPDIVAEAAKYGLNPIMISNGVVAGMNLKLCEALAKAGLKTAQISLESPDEAVHNQMVGNPHAWKATVQAIITLKSLGVHAYPNSTLAAANAKSIVGMPAFLKGLGITTWSSNGLVRAGRGLSNLDELGISYEEMSIVVPKMAHAAKSAGVRFTWYLPVPACIFPMHAIGFGHRGCTAANTVAITNSSGKLIACNNMHDEHLGDLLDPAESFVSMWESKAAKWWRNREFAPEFCRSCPHADTCRGACPLYWANGGNWREVGNRLELDLSANFTQNWRKMYKNRPTIQEE